MSEEKRSGYIKMLSDDSIEVTLTLKEVPQDLIEEFARDTWALWEKYKTEESK